MKIKVVVWNMHSLASNWDVITAWPSLADADVYLLCEATGWEERAPEGLHVVGHGSTKGIGCPCEGPRCLGRTYSTAIASRHRLDELPQGTRVDASYRKPLPFEPSRAGTWTAALVDLGQVTLTAIALYGLKDEAYDASLHRSLSELSPVFDRTHLNKHLVIGGDLNILPRPRVPDRLGRGQIVMERFRAYGLTECLQAARTEPGPEADRCTCQMGSACRHTRTFYGQDPHVPYQDDYLFASKSLVRKGRLVSCEALPVGPDSPSDHAPVIAIFDV